MSFNADKRWRYDPERPWRVPPYSHRESGFDVWELFWDVQEFVIDGYVAVLLLNIFVSFGVSQLLRPVLPDVNPIMPTWLTFHVLLFLSAAIYGAPTPTKGQRLEHRRRREAARRGL